jgi:hypothetical protein
MIEFMEKNKNDDDDDDSELHSWFLMKSVSNCMEESCS